MPSWPMAMPSSMAMVLNSAAKQPCCLDDRLDPLADVVQVHVARHELGEGVDDGDDRPAELLLLHAVGPPEGAGPGHAGHPLAG